jgi:hypothetical protein
MAGGELIWVVVVVMVMVSDPRYAAAFSCMDPSF